MAQLDISTPKPALGRHGFTSYSGHVDEHAASWASTTHFSLGIFAWQEKSGSSDLKPGKVKVRVQGFFSKAPEVYAKARELCVFLDAGGSLTQKSISV